jgi:hypothetical protein
MSSPLTSIIVSNLESQGSPALLYAQIILTAVLLVLLLAKELLQASAGVPSKIRAQAFDALIAPLLLASLCITVARIVDWLSSHPR